MSELASIIEDVRRVHTGDAWHGPSLQEALSGLTAEQAAAKPLPNAHSIWEIVSHITGWENVFRRRLEGEKQAAEPEAGDFPRVEDSTERAWQNALSDLETEHEKLLSVISRLSEQSLGENVAHRDYSVRFFLNGIIRHYVYHTGQIAILAKAVKQ